MEKEIPALQIIISRHVDKALKGEKKPEVGQKKRSKPIMRNGNAKRS